MKIKLSYAGYLHLENAPGNGASVELAGPCTIENLLERHGVREEHRRYILPTVNGRREGLSYVLKPGDELFLHLPAGGG